ncbi:MAG: hypothetical protein IPG01_03595 [Chitinophagaceae bacterium]|nr:hypothetical protein [Chitinophagaceae bacterium]
MFEGNGPNAQYFSDLWQEKRLRIIDRDNFTCQNISCKTFDPSSGEVQILEVDDELQIHSYNSYESIYTLSSSLTKLTLNIDFGWGNWLVPPILQVHHKRYIQGRDLWDYNDSDLITLCKECHKAFHQQYEIPLYDLNGNLINSIKYESKDNDHLRKHDFKPWVFVNKRNEQYMLCSELHPYCRMVIIAGYNDDNPIVKASVMVKDFFDKYLPDYRPVADVIEFRR